MGGFAIQSFWRETVNVWDLSGLKDILQVFDSLVVPSRSTEREEAAACLSEGQGVLRQRVKSSAMR